MPAISVGLLSLFLFILLVASIAILILQRSKIDEWEDKYAQLANTEVFFEKKPDLLRKDELEFYNILNSVIGKNYYVFPQTHLSEMVVVKNKFKDHDNLYEILGNKSVDYAIFSKDSMSPLLAIELNGTSHMLSGRTNRDALVSSILENVGISLIFIDKNRSNYEDILKDIILKLKYTENRK